MRSGTRERTMMQVVTHINAPSPKPAADRTAAKRASPVTNVVATSSVATHKAAAMPTNPQVREGHQRIAHDDAQAQRDDLAHRDYAHARERGIACFDHGPEQNRLDSDHQESDGADGQSRSNVRAALRWRLEIRNVNVHSQPGKWFAAFSDAFSQKIGLRAHPYSNLFALLRLPCARTALRLQIKGPSRILTDVLPQNAILACIWIRRGDEFAPNPAIDAGR